MVQGRVKKIGGSHYIAVPPDEARRLGLRDGLHVDVEVRPTGRSVQEVLRHRGALKGAFAREAKADLWGDG